MNINQNAIHTAASLLSEGKLVAFPTETVYGLGGDARNINAIQQIFRAKNRPATNPLIIHLSEISAIQEFARDIPETAYELAKHFWPGPLTLVLRKHPSVLEAVTGGQDSVALRIPNHPVARALLKAFDGGVAAPSANRSGGLSPTSAQHVARSLGKAVDYILEGGSCNVGIESTIVSLLDDTPVILRQGHIREAEIAQALNLPSLATLPKNAIESPGSALQHYAPIKPLFLYGSHALKNQLFLHLENNIHPALLTYSLDKVAVLKEITPQFSMKPTSLPWITLSNDPKMYAQQLYAALHELDATAADCILVELPPLNTAWLAIHDRLSRAAIR